MSDISQLYSHQNGSRVKYKSPGVFAVMLSIHIYRILHESSCNINFYEMSLLNVIMRASCKHSSWNEVLKGLYLDDNCKSKIIFIT